MDGLMERELKTVRALNDQRRLGGRLGKSSGRHTMQMTTAMLNRAVDKYGHGILKGDAGWGELHEQGRFYGLVDAGVAPGHRNRFGRVTWSKRYEAGGA